MPAPEPKAETGIGGKILQHALPVAAWTVGAPLAGELFNKTKDFVSRRVSNAWAQQGNLADAAASAAQKAQETFAQHAEAAELARQVYDEHKDPQELIKQYGKDTTHPFYGATPFLQSALKTIGAQMTGSWPQDEMSRRFAAAFAANSRAQKMPVELETLRPAERGRPAVLSLFTPRDSELSRFDRRMQNRNDRADVAVDVARAFGAGGSAAFGTGGMDFSSLAPMLASGPEGATFTTNNTPLNAQSNPASAPGQNSPSPSPSPDTAKTNPDGTVTNQNAPAGTQEVSTTVNKDQGAAATQAANRVAALAAQYKDKPDQLQTLANPEELKKYQNEVNYSVQQVEAAGKAGKISPEQVRFQKGQLMNAALVASQAVAANVTGQVPKIDVLRDQLNAATPGTPLYNSWAKQLTDNNPQLVADLAKAHPDAPNGPMDRIEQVWNALGDEKLAGGWGRTLVLGGMALSMIGLFSSLFGGGLAAGLMPMIGGLGMAAAPFLMGGGLQNKNLQNALGGLVGQQPAYAGHRLTPQNATSESLLHPMAVKMMDMVKNNNKAGALAMFKKELDANPKLRESFQRMGFTTPWGNFVRWPGLTPKAVADASDGYINEPVAQTLFDNWDEASKIIKGGSFLGPYLHGRRKQAADWADSGLSGGPPVKRKPFFEDEPDDVPMKLKRPAAAAPVQPMVNLPYVDPRKVVEGIDSVMPRGNGYNEKTDRMGIPEAPPLPSTSVGIGENAGRFLNYLGHNYSAAPSLLYNTQGEVATALHNATKDWDKDNPWDPVASTYRDLAELADKKNQPELATLARYGSVVGPNALMSPTNLARNGPLMLPYMLPGLSAAVSLGDGVNEFRKGNPLTGLAYGLAGIVPGGKPLAQGLLGKSVKTMAQSPSMAARAAGNAITTAGKATELASHVGPIGAPLGRDIQAARQQATQPAAAATEEKPTDRPQVDAAIGKTSAPGAVSTGGKPVIDEAAGPRYLDALQKQQPTFGKPEKLVLPPPLPPGVKPLKLGPVR